MAGWFLDSGILLLQFTPSHVPPASHLPYSSVRGILREPSSPDSHLTTNQGYGARCCY